MQMLDYLDYLGQHHDSLDHLLNVVVVGPHLNCIAPGFDQPGLGRDFEGLNSRLIYYDFPQDLLLNLLVNELLAFLDDFLDPLPEHLDLLLMMNLFGDLLNLIDYGPDGDISIGLYFHWYLFVVNVVLGL